MEIQTHLYVIRALETPQKKWFSKFNNNYYPFVNTSDFTFFESTGKLLLLSISIFIFKPSRKLFILSIKYHINLFSCSFQFSFDKS